VWALLRTAECQTLKTCAEAKMKMRDEEDDAAEEFPEAPTLRETGSCVSA
jgi:hypothetical protein